jgi:hypothetical protein
VDFTKIETVLGIIAGATVLTFVGWAVSSFGMASPHQLLAYDVGQTLEADGVAVDRVSCEPSGAATKCRVNLTGGGLTSVMVARFEDGSWRFLNTDDRP